MAKSDEIQKAIAAHGMWKVRLRSAIDTGKSEWTAGQVKVDNLCEFGKWLHSLPDYEKKAGNWGGIREMHAKFHEEAAKILDSALTGKKEAAARGLEKGSDFTKLSSSLTAAMMNWLKAS